MGEYSSLIAVEPFYQILASLVSVLLTFRCGGDNLCLQKRPSELSALREDLLVCFPKWFRDFCEFLQGGANARRESRGANKVHLGMKTATRLGLKTQAHNAKDCEISSFVRPIYLPVRAIE